MGGTTTPAQAAQTLTDASQQAGWEQAAQTATPSNSSPASPAPAASPAATPATATTGVSGVTFPQTTPPPSAPVVTSQKRGGILGVIDTIADALTGRTTPEIGTDPQGNQYVKQRTLSHGEQWMRIGLEAAHGAAEGLAAGRGVGNIGKAAAAGFNAGADDQEKRNQAGQQMSAQARQQNLDNANNQMLRMNMAEQAWRFTRMKQQANQSNIDWANGQIDRYQKEGGQVLGTAAHAADIGQILKVNPDLMRDMVVNHQIELVPHYTEDGVADGVTAVKMPNGYRNQMLPAGTEFHTFDSATGKLIAHQSASPMTAGERDDYETAAGTAQMKFQSDKAEQDLKTQQAAEAKANAANAPSVAAKNRAEAGSASAEAELRRAQAAQTRAGMMNVDGSPNPVFQNLVQALYDGDIMPSDLKRETAGKGIDPNQVVAGAVSLGKQTGHPWSESIIKQEQKFAEGTKTQAALDGIDRIVGPSGYMQTMLQTAKDAHLATNGAFNSLQLAIRRTSGETSAKNFETAVSETRRSIAGLIGNPLLGGSETDKKLEQAEGMLGGSPTMANLNGAASLLTSALQTQRASIIGNNRFLVRRYGATAAGSSSAQSAPPAPPPAPAGFSNIWAPGSPTWKQVPTNQIPKNIPGLVTQ